MKKPLNKEQLEALVAAGRMEAAIVMFADAYGIPASELAGFVDCILFAKFQT